MRLRVEACGICGSDLHFWPGHLRRPRWARRPATRWPVWWSTVPPGSPDVRYAGSPNITCGVCINCRTGRSNLCGRAGPGIGLGVDGGLAELVDAPLENLAPIPDDVDAVTASLTGAVGGDRARRRSGAGRARHQGARARRRRHRPVRHAGGATAPPRWPSPRATRTNAPPPEAIGVSVLGEDEAVTWGKEHRPEVVVESVGGTADTLTDAVRVVGRGGRVVVLGTFSEPRLVDLQRLMMKEGSIVGRSATAVATASPSSTPPPSSPVAGGRSSRPSRPPAPAGRRRRRLRARRRQEERSHQGHPHALEGSVVRAR